jgi:hypothetical protein
MGMPMGHARMLVELESLRAAQRFPARWGEPPAMHTINLVALPGGYGEDPCALDPSQARRRFPARYDRRR